MTAHLILASASPRRASLLRESGYEVEAVTPPFDDTHTPLTNLPPKQAVVALARRKARSVAETLDAGTVIGADTVVLIDGDRLGKPADRVEAEGMLCRLIGATHTAATGVCLVDAATGDETAFVDTTDVSIGPVSRNDLQAYLDSNQWRGKAGGYNLAELTGRWSFEITGDPTTVVGLPMRRLTEELGRLGRHGTPHT